MTHDTFCRRRLGLDSSGKKKNLANKKSRAPVRTGALRFSYLFFFFFSFHLSVYSFVRYIKENDKNGFTCTHTSRK